MTITQYNSNNSLIPEFQLALFKKINNIDELINIPTILKKDLWSKFRLRPRIRTSRKAQSGFHAKIHSWFTIHSVFKIRESARFMQGAEKNAKIHNPCAFWGQIRRSENLFTFKAAWVVLFLASVILRLTFSGCLTVEAILRNIFVEQKQL